MQQWDLLMNFRCKDKEKKNKRVYSSSSVVSGCEGLGPACTAGHCFLRNIWGRFHHWWNTLWVLSSVQVVLDAKEVLGLVGDKASPLTCGLVANLPNQCQGVLAMLPWAQEQGHRLHPWCGYCCVSLGSSFSTSALWLCCTRVKRTNELLNLKNTYILEKSF